LSVDSAEKQMPQDDRIVAETGIDARISAVIEPVMTGLGFRLVRVRLTGQNGLTLQIMAEREDGSMTVEDCEELSRVVSPVLDVEDLIDKAYHLEVSSPGIDRPLVARRDFANWQGHLAKVETAAMIDGKRKFRGRIEAADENGFRLVRDQIGYGETAEVTIPFDAVTDARLILTDDLIREALRKDKAARADRKKQTRTEAAGEPEHETAAKRK
jgi:ribosome maturation factor RimP